MPEPDGWAWQVAAAMRRRQWLVEQQVEVERRIERLLMAMPPCPVAPARVVQALSEASTAVPCAAGCTIAVLHSHYADGVVQHWA